MNLEYQDPEELAGMIGSIGTTMTDYEIKRSFILALTRIAALERSVTGLRNRLANMASSDHP